MQLTENKINNRILLSLFIIVTALISIHTAKVIGLNALYSRQWISMLTWKIPFIQFFSSILLVVISRNLPRFSQDRILANDIVSYSWLILFYFMVLFQKSLDQLWIGCIYFSLLYYKALLISHLIVTRVDFKLKLNALKIIYLASLLWFFTATTAWFAPMHEVSGDEPHYLLMTHSLLRDHDLNLYNEYSNKIYSTYYQGILKPKLSDYVGPQEIISRGLGPLYSLTLIPGYILAGYHGVLLENVIIASLLICNLFLLAYEFSGNMKLSLITSMISAGTLPVIVYSSLIYPDLLGALIILIILRLLKKSKYHASWKQIRKYYLFIFALSLFLLILKFRFISFVFPLFLTIILSELIFRKQAIKPILGVLIFSSLYIFLDVIIFHGDVFLGRFHAFVYAQQFVPSFKSILVPFGIFLDQEAGIIFYSPIFLVVLLGIFSCKNRKSLIYIVALTYFIFVIISLLGHFAWHNLPTPPMRYVFPALILFFVFITDLLSKDSLLSFFQLISIIVLTIISVGLHLLFLIFPGWLINLADGTSEFFLSLSKVCHFPFVYYFPSIIRISPIAFFWIVMFLAFCFLFYRKPKKRFSFFEISVPVSVLFLISSICIIAYLSMLSYPMKVEAEDVYFSNPTGGNYYPKIKDPFFRRETQMGWRLDPNDSLFFKILHRSVRYNLLIRAKVKTYGDSSRVCVTNLQNRREYVSITNPKWCDYLLPVYFQSTNDSYPIKITCIGPQAVIIDSVKLISPHKLYFKLYNELQFFTMLSRFPRCWYYISRYFLVHHPGDPWFYFNKYVSEGKVLPRPLPEAQNFPLSPRIVTLGTKIIAEQDIDYILDFEKLFNFNGKASIKLKNIPQYFIKKIKENDSNIYKELSEYYVLYPSSMLEEALILAYFQSKYYWNSIDLLSEMVLRNPQKLNSIFNPQSVLSEESCFYNEYEILSKNPYFKRAVKLYLISMFESAINIYYHSNLCIFQNIINKLYCLDQNFFIELCRRENNCFFQYVLPDMKCFDSDDLRLLAQKLYHEKRFNEALICAGISLIKQPFNSENNIMYTKIYLNLKNCTQAYKHCLYGINTDFQNDDARVLLINILKYKKENNLIVGYPK